MTIIHILDCTENDTKGRDLCQEFRGAKTSAL